MNQLRVRELFDYDVVAGMLVRKTKIGKCHPGDIAGVVRKDGRRAIKVDYVSYLAYRLVWLWHNGYLPETGIDHIDRNNSNDRIENLREVSQTCNLRNTGNWSNNKSGVKGVTFDPSKNQWLVRIWLAGRRKYLGLHNDFTEAVAHRLAAEQCLNWETCDSSSPAYEYMRRYQLS